MPTQARSTRASNRRYGGTAVALLALVGGVLYASPPAGAVAAGDASASAADVNLNVTLLGQPTPLSVNLPLAPVSVTTGAGTQTSTNSTLSSGLLGVLGNNLITADAVTTTATSTATGSSAQAHLVNAKVALPGAGNLLTADVIDASASCPVGGTPTTSVTSPAVLTVLGSPVTLSPGTGPVTITVPLLGSVTVALGATATTTATAAATALTLTVGLNVIGIAATAGSITLAHASCATPGATTVPTQTAPSASFTYATSGDNATFDASATTGTTPLSYGWSFGDGTTGSGPTPSHTYATAGSYPVTLTATNPAGSSTITTTVVIAAGTSGTGTSGTGGTGAPPGTPTTAPTTTYTTATTLTLSTSKQVFGRTVTATAKVITAGRAANGRVEFLIGTTPVRIAALSHGSVKVALPIDTHTGAHIVHAVFLQGTIGHTTYKTSQAAKTLRITQAKSTVSMAIAHGTVHHHLAPTYVTFAVKVIGASHGAYANGRFKIYLDGLPVRGAILYVRNTDHLNIRLPQQPIGTYTIRAVFIGGLNVAGSTPPRTVTLTVTR